MDNPTVALSLLRPVYCIVCDKAKALGVQFAEDADEVTIKRAVVDAKLKDAARAGVVTGVLKV